MSDARSGGTEPTVGSLMGVPLGAAPPQSVVTGDGRPLPPGLTPVSPEETEGQGWVVRAGEAFRTARHVGFRPDAMESLEYNNPFNQGVERVWFDGKIVYASEQGELELTFDDDFTCVGNKVAQEYQVVYAVDLDERGKLIGEAELVPGQYNVYDSVPGMEQYSPLWQFNYVVVPRGYVANTLRSERDCLQSGYTVIKSTVVEN